ncbi:MAG: chitobiase/beta-hexosaminidase C-terminal domain-containing protein [Terriglobales bacterium]
MNSLKSRLFVIACILVSLCSSAFAQSIVFGQVETGTIAAAAQSNSYTFSANANDLIDFTATQTSGTLSPALKLYSSGGKLIASAANCSSPVIEMNGVMLPASDTYTLLLSDCSDTQTGNYALYAQRTNNPSGATNLPFGQTEAGTISLAAQSNTYTFTANANDILDFTATQTSGTLSPKIRLFNPAGTLLNTAANCSSPVTEMNGVTLPASGTYTVLLGDCSDTQIGNYEIYAQRTDNPSGAANLVFGQTQAGSISVAAQSNTYTFSADANDVIIFTATQASGTLSPKIRLYNPAGTLLNTVANCSSPVIEMSGFTLPVSGTYTVLLGDCSDTQTGNYDIYSQRMNNPSGAANLPFGLTQTGSISSVAQSNTYTFSANANDVIIFTATQTSGTLSPKIRLYNSAGTLLETAANCSSPVIEMNGVTLAASGTYTVLLGDCSDTQKGNYALYTQRTNNPAGAIGLLWGQVQTGKIGSAAQSDTYTFLGNANDSIDLTAVATSGTLSPKIRLYNPAGTLLATAANCSSGTIQLNGFTIPVSGTYTMLVGDCSDTQTGNYNLSSQCFGTCPTSGAPTLSSLSPPTALAGSSGFTLTANGSNFLNGSVVQWNGSARATTFVSANQLTASILASDITTPGPVPVTVLNPTAPVGPSNALTFNVDSSTPAATPVFSPKAGKYKSAQSVTITDATVGAVIYYTTDGSTPTTKSTMYNGAITVSANETIKAIAAATDYPNSAVASATYMIEAATPVFSPKAGKYTSAQSVTITDATTGAVIYYTTNGTTPTTKSTQYSGAITVSETETIKAIAAATGYANSAVASAIYTIAATTPVFSPKAGRYKSAQSVTITDTTPGAVIYYTTDGTTPTTKSTQYGGAITVSTNTTVEAIAVATDYSNSAVAKAIYTIVAATPVFSPKAGKYASAQSVTITDATTGAVIYYTTDGSIPTTKSTQYAGAIAVSATETIKAIAVATDYANSAVATAIYTIE